MPIFDQGYQHWDGPALGPRLAMAGDHPARRRRPVEVAGRPVVVLAALVPAARARVFLIVWGLFEQQSSLITPFLQFLQTSPRSSGRGRRLSDDVYWTMAFHYFFDIEIFFPMLLVLLVGPNLISQDLRFNAIPLYFSRPVRRFDYFLGKLGVIATFVAAVIDRAGGAGLRAGVAFSLDATVIRDTAHLLAGSVGYGAVVVVSAGTLMLAISSLSRNSRMVGALWVGFWIDQLGVVGRVAEHRATPSGARWSRTPRTSTGCATPCSTRARPGTRSPAWARRDAARWPAGWASGRSDRAGSVPPRHQPPDRPPFEVETGDGMTSGRNRSPWAPATYPWQWSASVLAGLAVVSVLILTTRVRGLDRLR